MTAQPESYKQWKARTRPTWRTGRRSAWGIVSIVLLYAFIAGALGAWLRPSVELLVMTGFLISLLYSDASHWPIYTALFAVSLAVVVRSVIRDRHRRIVDKVTSNVRLLPLDRDDRRPRSAILTEW